MSNQNNGLTKEIKLALLEALPEEFFEALTRLVQQKRSGSVELHVKQGQILAGEQRETWRSSKCLT